MIENTKELAWLGTLMVSVALVALLLSKDASRLLSQWDFQLFAAAGGFLLVVGILSRLFVGEGSR